MYGKTIALLFVCAAVVPVAGNAQLPAGADESPVKAGSIRLVRFYVKADMAQRFEAFFWESLLPAAGRLSPAQKLPEQVRRFRVLRPTGLNPDSALTYYVIWEAGQDAGAQTFGQNMRQLVREAFPADDAQVRIERWMESIDLEKLVPVGATFLELDFAAYLDDR